MGYKYEANGNHTVYRYEDDPMVAETFKGRALEWGPTRYGYMAIQSEHGNVQPVSEYEAMQVVDAIKARAAARTAGV